MGNEFHNTKYGQIFFEVQLPQLLREIGRLANAVENNNQLLFDAQKDSKSKNYCDVLTCANRSKDGFCTKDVVALNSDSVCEDRSNEETTDNETTPGSTSGTDSGSGSGSSSGGNSKIDNPLDVDLKGATIKIYQGSTAFSSFVVKDPSTKTLKSYNEILKTVQKELNCKFEVVDITEDKLKSQVMASAITKG